MATNGFYIEESAQDTQKLYLAIEICIKSVFRKGCYSHYTLLGNILPLESYDGQDAF